MGEDENRSFNCCSLALSRILSSNRGDMFCDIQVYESGGVKKAFESCQSMLTRGGNETSYTNGKQKRLDCLNGRERRKTEFLYEVR